MIFDVAIIGAGPAGAIAAILLRRAGLSVYVAERNNFDTIRPGEILAPPVVRSFKALSISSPELSNAIVESPGVISKWGSDEINQFDYIFSPHGVGWNLDRNHFDKSLVAIAIENGAVFDNKTNVT